jgi:hypothetical protein
MKDENIIFNGVFNGFSVSGISGDREAIENTVKLKFSTGRYKIINIIFVLSKD